MKTNESSKLKINYQLKNEKSTKKPVIVNINFGYKELDLLTRKYKYKPIIMPTGIRLLPTEWDAENKMPLNLDDRNRLYEVNTIINQVYQYLSLKGKVFYQDFKDELEEKLRGKEKVVEVERIKISDFILNHIMTSERLTKGTKSNYKNLANKLEEFEKQKGIAVMSNNLDEDLYLDIMDFVRLMVNKINSVWTIQKIFKSVLYEISRFYKISVFSPGKELSVRDKVQSENADAVYLNMEQIQKIIKFNPKEDRLSNAKYIFMILLFTGCRVSDVYKIAPDKKYSSKGTSFNYVRYTTQKTETEIICPILKPLQTMFDKNKGKPPRKVALHKLNTYLRELAMKSKLDEEITTSHTDSNGKRKSVKKKLHEFISSHTGRRSFITNLINYIPIPILTKITGHKLEDKNIIFAYNKMTLLENAVLFYKQLPRVTSENSEYFPFQLV
ncbi:Phage integrase family protein [compost metagenome]